MKPWIMMLTSNGGSDDNHFHTAESTKNSKDSLIASLRIYVRLGRGESLKTMKYLVSFLGCSWLGMSWCDEATRVWKSSCFLTPVPLAEWEVLLLPALVVVDSSMPALPLLAILGLADIKFGTVDDDESPSEKHSSLSLLRLSYTQKGVKVL